MMMKSIVIIPRITAIENAEVCHPRKSEFQTG